jgi:hypothetical protein
MFIVDIDPTNRDVDCLCSWHVSSDCSSYRTMSAAFLLSYLYVLLRHIDLQSGTSKLKG